MGKSSLGTIANGYFKTLHKGASDDINPKDVALHIVFPILVGVFSFAIPQIDLQVVRALFSNLIVAVSIVSALLCGLAVMVFQVRIQLSSEDMDRKATGNEKQLIDEMFSVVLWSVVCGFASVALMVLSGTKDSAGQIYDAVTALSLALVIHYAIVTCMCLKRLNAVYIIVSQVWPKK